MAKHQIVHVEIPARDTKAASSFYAELFGWNMETDDQFDYTMFSPGDGPGGGFVTIDGEKTKPGDVVVYVDTDDLDATIAKAESLGATTVVAKTEIPGMGWFAVIVDPSGNKLGLWRGSGGQ